MARPRRAAAAAKIVRQRDYAAEYRRRQERARAAGFENYYAQRVRGGARARAGTAAPTGAALRRARGHASAEDFIRELKPGALVEVTDYDRSSDGTVKRLGLLVTDEDGSESSYNISHAGLRGGKVGAILAAIQNAGAIDSPKYGIHDLFEHDEPDESEAEAEE